MLRRAGYRRSAATRSLELTVLDTAEARELVEPELEVAVEFHLVEPSARCRFPAGGPRCFDLLLVVPVLDDRVDRIRALARVLYGRGLLVQPFA